MKGPSLLDHLRDILILPFTVTVIVPYLLLPSDYELLPESIFWKISGILLLILGSALFMWTVMLFDRNGKGTLAPWQPTAKLIVKGPYKHCRNPMITGVFIILLGEFFLLNSLDTLIWALIFFIINTVYFIFKEEPDLLKRFGKEYERYKKNVPRWLPRLKPYNLDKK